MHNTSWVYIHQSVSFSDKICILWIPQILSLQICKPWKSVYLNSPRRCRKFLHVFLQKIFTTNTCKGTTMLIRSVHTGFTYPENSWKWITGYTYFTQYNVHPSYCMYMFFDISQSIFLGALPPVDLQAVCFVRAMVWAPPYILPSSAVAWQARKGTGIREWRRHSNAREQPPSVFLNVVSATSIFCFVLESK